MLCRAQSAPASNPATIGEVYAADVSVKGAVQLADSGLQISSGSSVTAGGRAAVLRLSRGGELRVCAKTTITANAGPNRDLMFSMSSGSLETDYHVPATADVVMTPDFRIVISGPAAAKVAVGVTSSGQTCVRNATKDAYVIVSELLGNGNLRVEGEKEYILHSGSVTDAQPSTEACGCPQPAPANRELSIASAKAPEPPMPKIALPEPPKQELASAATKPAAESSIPPTASAPAPAENKVQVSVDAPFIYEEGGAAPDPSLTIAKVRLDGHAPVPLAMAPAKPEAPAKGVLPASQKVAKEKPKHGFFGRLGSFFASMFGRG